MTIEEMHYDFSKKLNKVNSHRNKNLLIPEIDWSLNEAQELFVKLVAFPKRFIGLGFEIGQRTIDDIKTIVEPSYCIPVVDNIAKLPDNYWLYVNGQVKMEKEGCTATGQLKVRQHNDSFEESTFDNSSFEWRHVNGVFDKYGVKLYSSDFNINSLCIDYIRKLSYIHNAHKTRTGEYKLPSGKILSGSQDCELPEDTHREIVDIAVLMVTGELGIPDYQIKANKLNFNQINR